MSLPSRLTVITTEEDAVNSLTYKQQGVPNGYFVSQGCLLGQAIIRTYGQALHVGFSTAWCEDPAGRRIWKARNKKVCGALVQRWCDAKPDPETDLKAMARKLKLVGRTVVFEEVTK